MNNRRLVVICLLFFAPLTIIKMFTGVVVRLGDPTDLLVFKAIPTLRNFWSLGEEALDNLLIYQGTWYLEERYWVIASSENGFGFIGYHLLIFLWWLGSILLLGYGLLKLYKKVIWDKKLS